MLPDELARQRTLRDVERAYIEAVLAECAGNKSRAATVLGISVKTIDRRQKLWVVLDSRLQAETHSENNLAGK